MRILRVAQKLYPDVKGGGAYHVHALSRDQAAMGHDVHVLTVDHDGDGPYHEQRDGYTITRYPPTAEPLGNAISLGLARHLRRADGIDVVHAHSHLYFATNVAAAVSRRRGLPLAITNHGLYSQSAPRWLFEGYLRTLGRWTFESADAVFCYTETDERRLRERGVRAPIEVVHNGIDTDRFTPEGPTSDLLDAGERAVLYVGRLVGGKRPGDLVDAFATVRESVPDAHLYVAGTGPLREELERSVSGAGLESAVTFLGHVPYEEMPAVYRSADLLALPSESEGFPRTVLEALASGTAVVTTDLPQLRDVVADCGELVPVGDSEALAQAIVALCTDGERRESLGERGRAVVTEEFAWADTVERTTRTLSALVGEE